MNAKSKIVLITAAACVAIGTPVYLQQREIRILREENAALRAAAPPRRNMLPVSSAPEPGGNSVTPGAETVSARSSGSELPITARTRDFGNRKSGTAAELPSGLSGNSGDAATGAVPGLTQSNLVSGDYEAGIEYLGLGGRGSSPTVAGKAYWDHAQATGAPDTARAGDQPTAWAPLKYGSGEQWLALGYNKAVELKEVNIHETYNPGAISKVAAVMPDGSEKVLWQGTAVKAASGDESLETSVPVPPGTTASRIKVYVDTNRVGSWPEIDAVEMVGRNGTRQWASSSSASTSYSDNYRALGGAAAPEPTTLSR